ncbi:hypothetical protein B0H13DRAFT_1862192 [Mycena leptocephala]|nr:hypothetical protein B0H13DRAFT_1862192 [Mycena leptocephala]
MIQLLEYISWDFFTGSDPTHTKLSTMPSQKIRQLLKAIASYWRWTIARCCSTGGSWRLTGQIYSVRVSANTDARRKGTVWIAKALVKVQRLAAKHITGALRTTATDTMDFHANLLPIHIRLNRSVFNAAARESGYEMPSGFSVRIERAYFKGKRLRIELTIRNLAKTYKKKEKRPAPYVQQRAVSHRLRSSPFCRESAIKIFTFIGLVGPVRGSAKVPNRRSGKS